MIKKTIGALIAMLFVVSTLQAGELSLSQPQAGMDLAAKKKVKKKRVVEEVDGFKQDVYANIGGFVYGIASVGYEKAIKSDQSFTIEGSYSSKGDGTLWNWTTIGVGASWRFWLKQLVDEGSLKGVYVGPAVRVQSLTYTYDVTTVNTSVWPYTYGTKKESSGGMFFGGGAQGGYQWIFDNGFLLNGGLEIGFLTGSVSVASGGTALGFGGTYSGIVGAVGYAF
jgi:hypothetical protein